MKYERRLEAEERAFCIWCTDAAGAQPGHRNCHRSKVRRQKSDVPSARYKVTGVVVIASPERRWREHGFSLVDTRTRKGGGETDNFGGRAIRIY